MNSVKIPLNKIHPNTGQIEGVPRNPRFIRDARFEALKKSISDAPDMAELRELIVFPDATKRGHYVTIGGNMRLRAHKELGWVETDCKVLPKNTPPAKLVEIAIKDNVAFGQDDYDILANEYDGYFPLEDYGMELPETYGFSEEFVENEGNGKNQPDDGYFQFAVPVTAEQRGKIMEALRKAKAENAIEHSGQALAFIADEFIS